MLLHQGEDDVLQSHHITGVITEFHEKPIGKTSVNSHKSPSRISIAVVEIKADSIAQSGHARIIVPRDKFAIGTEVPLILKLYSNGSRKIILASEPDNRTQTGD